MIWAATSNVSPLGLTEIAVFAPRISSRLASALPSRTFGVRRQERDSRLRRDGLGDEGKANRQRFAGPEQNPEQLVDVGVGFEMNGVAQRYVELFRDQWLQRKAGIVSRQLEQLDAQLDGVVANEGLEKNDVEREPDRLSLRRVEITRRESSSGRSKSARKPRLFAPSMIELATKGKANRAYPSQRSPSPCRADRKEKRESVVVHPLLNEGGRPGAAAMKVSSTTPVARSNWKIVGRVTFR